MGRFLVLTDRSLVLIGKNRPMVKSYRIITEGIHRVRKYPVHIDVWNFFFPYLKNDISSSLVSLGNKATVLLWKVVN